MKNVVFWDIKLSSYLAGDATGRRNLVPTFADRGVSRGQRGGSSTVVNLSFLDRSH
jgi:hypothetical protein